MNIRLRSLLKRALQAVLLVVAGVVVALAIGVYAEYSATLRWPSGRWLILGIWTLLVFGDVARDFRRNWNQPMFWLLMLSLLAAHTAGYGVTLTVVEEWRAVWFLPISIGEVLVLKAILRASGFGARRSARTVGR